jgi:putative sigma-54 modulation protein
MTTSIRAHGFALTSSLRDHVERQLHHALGRLAHKVRSVVVRLSDTNGPRGGVDKRCLVHVSLPAMPAVVIEESEADMYVAIDRATTRVGQSVGRRIASRRNRS